MALTAAEILQVMEKAKELGLQQIKVEGFEASFGPAINQVKEMAPQLSTVNPLLGATQPVPELKAEDIVNPMSVFDEMTDEEIMYWSTPYYQELQDKKEAMRQAKESEGNK